MTECRFFPWCSYIEDHGCTKDWCNHYQPMPDVEQIAELADEMETVAASKEAYMVPYWYLDDYAERIREALGVEDGR